MNSNQKHKAKKLVINIAKSLNCANHIFKFYQVKTRQKMDLIGDEIEDGSFLVSVSKFKQKFDLKIATLILA